MPTFSEVSLALLKGMTISLFLYPIMDGKNNPGVYMMTCLAVGSMVAFIEAIFFPPKIESEKSEDENK